VSGSPALERIDAALAGGRSVRVGGAWGSSYALLAARVPRPTLVLVPTPLEAEQAVEDFACFEARAELHRGLREAERFRAGEIDLLVAALPDALAPLPAPRRVEAARWTFAPGMPFDLAEAARRLVEARYERAASVERPGEFAVRGGILDLYPPTADRPLRVELLGNAVESVRAFDPATQLSTEALPRAEISLVPLDAPGEAALFDYLPARAAVVLKEPAELEQRSPGWARAWPEGSRRATLWISALPQPEAENLRIRSLQRFSGVLARVEEELAAVRRGRTVVFCANEGEERRLRELVRFPVEIRRGRLGQGFVFEEIDATFVSHHELFNRYRLRRGPVRRAETRPIDALLEIGPGDLVVHVTHGIGRFVGIDRRDGKEFLAIEYAGGARLFVPVTNLDLVQKYVGGGEAAPPLSVLGGTAWGAAKARAEQAVEKLAREMLRVQALREMELGTAFPPDPEWQREFEAAFPYEETEDQLRVAEEIARDMHSPRPMDRLVCGDVGYGKTELAMRAAFRAVLAHKQVAVLVPTTVLAQQHAQTFRERMADYPIRVEVLSRFRSRADQARVVRDLAEGRVDIVIGTHRLLQPDVRFKDLGLVVVDEEQRFGVEHKEFLKRLRATVDVLTLTATPIPRTLHMALLGIRDISALATPPQDRLAIQTEILPYDERRIREGILRELERGGQVYFVHNRVHSIDEVRRRLEFLVPEARFAVGHGRMDEEELERTMVRFLEREVDVLVCTTIIESGLDIPNVNTIFIDQADLFGLADLHQLRGRVGRYRVQAYCYLLLPRDRPIVPQARKRLKAIEEFQELGAGFKIALRDLEIRGVGNLLGREQHGHIAAVGYDLYCKLLEKAVRRARREPVAEPLETHVDLGEPSWVPEEYVPDVRTRIEVYRRLTGCRSEEDLEATARELEDRFGAPPEPVRNFLRSVRVKLRAARWDLASLARGREGLVAKYRDRRKAEALRRRRPEAVRLLDEETLLIVDGDPAALLAPPEKEGGGG
jgi:transcription-repair coupling factor (superfamily II helicase)